MSCLLSRDAWGSFDRTAVGNPCPCPAGFCFPSSPISTIWFLYLRGSSSGFHCSCGITQRAHRDFIAARTRSTLTLRKLILNWTWVSSVSRSVTHTQTLWLYELQVGFVGSVRCHCGLLRQVLNVLIGLVGRCRWYDIGGDDGERWPRYYCASTRQTHSRLV
jgi:hypothetical protein